MKLSVIIPVFNCEKYLSRCLDSVINQTYRDLEILVINDGSTDNSLIIAERYKKKDERISIYNLNNSGVSSARNYGIQLAKGDYITFVDADDFLDINAYECIKTIIGYDALFFGYKEYYPEEDRFRVIKPNKIGIVNGREALYQCLLPIGFGYFTSVWNKIFKKEKIINEKFSEDIKIGEDELWLVEVLKNIDQVKLINDCYYNYSQNNLSTIHSGYEVGEKWVSALKAKKRILRNLNEDRTMFDLSAAKLYDDMFQMLWYSYVTNNRKKYLYFYNELKPFKGFFLKSNLYSKKKKLKYSIIEKMIKLHFPKKVISIIGEMKTYRIMSNIFGELYD